MRAIRYLIFCFVACATNVAAQQASPVLVATVTSASGETSYSSDTNNTFLRLDSDAILEFYAGEQDRPLTFNDRVLEFGAWSDGSRVPLQVGEYESVYRQGGAIPEGTGVTIIGAAFCDQGVDTIDKVSITKLSSAELVEDKIAPNSMVKQVSTLDITFNKYCGSVDTQPILSGFINFDVPSRCEQKIDTLKYKLLQATRAARLSASKLRSTKSDVNIASGLIGLAISDCKSLRCRTYLNRAQARLNLALTR